MTSGSTAAATDGSISSPDAGPLAWAKCIDPKATDATIECATITVALDYTNPSKATIDLALIRIPATERTGAVLFNPGGPGGSGFDAIAQGTWMRSVFRFKDWAKWCDTNSQCTFSSSDPGGFVPTRRRLLRTR